MSCQLERSNNQRTAGPNGLASQSINLYKHFKQSAEVFQVFFLIERKASCFQRKCVKERLREAARMRERERGREREEERESGRKRHRIILKALNNSIALVNAYLSIKDPSLEKANHPPRNSIGLCAQRFG